MSITYHNTRIPLLHSFLAPLVKHCEARQAFFTWQTYLFFHLLSTHWLFCISSWRKEKKGDCSWLYTLSLSVKVLLKNIYIYIYQHATQRCNCFGTPHCDKSNTIITRRADPLWKLKLLKDVLKQICSSPFLKLLERYLQLLKWVSKFFWAFCFWVYGKSRAGKTKHVLQLAEQDLKGNSAEQYALGRLK